MNADLVYVPVGSDRLQAQVIAEACRRAGIRLELLTADESGVDPVMGIVQGHRLLVTAKDVKRVESIRGRLQGTG